MVLVPELHSSVSQLRGAGTPLVRFAGFKVKQKHGPEYFCGYSKRPLCGPDGGECYLVGEFVKNRDSRGRPRWVTVRVGSFAKRLTAIDQSMDWFLSHLRLEGEPAAVVALSRTQRTRLARRLKPLGFHVSLSVPNPLPTPAQTPVNTCAAGVESGTCSMPAPGVTYVSAQEEAERFDVCVGIGPASSANQD